MARSVVVWVAEGTWPACVEAARTWAPDDAEVVLLYVSGGELAVARGALAGLFGRGSRMRDSGRTLDALANMTAAELLDRAARQLGRPAETPHRVGQVERNVVHAADGADPPPPRD